MLPTNDLPRWFALAWHTPTVRDQLLADAASSAGQHNVSLGLAAEYAMPLPPAAEQVRILEEVERLTSVADSSEAATAENHGRCARLRQSILKWAFEGKLVDQDPNDEPASALLACIKANQAAPKATSTPRRRAKQTA
jgi:type I restriction enzyme S subunit